MESHVISRVNSLPHKIRGNDFRGVFFSRCIFTRIYIEHFTRDWSQVSAIESH